MRRRGEEYHWQKLVRIEDGGESSVKATIRGSQQYDVELTWQPGKLTVYCDCPYFESNGPCKHLWATLLTAEARGLLSSAAADAHVELDDTLQKGSDFTLKSPRVTAAVPKVAAWRRQLAGIAEPVGQAHPQSASWPAKRELLYVVDAPASQTAASLVLILESRDRKKDGSYSRHARVSIKREQIRHLPLPEDRETVAMLAGGVQYWGFSPWDGAQIPTQCRLDHPLSASVLRLAARTGRLFLRATSASDDLAPLALDEGEPWVFALELTRTKSGELAVDGFLKRGETRLPSSEVALITPGGLVFTKGVVAALSEDAPFHWIQYLRRSGPVVAPESEREEFLAALLSSPDLPGLEMPPEIRVEEVALSPRPSLTIQGGADARMSGALGATLGFDYSSRTVSAADRTRGWYDEQSRTFHRRDLAAENAAADLLQEAGARRDISRGREAGWEIAPKKLPRLVRTLVGAGWHMEAEGKIFRKPADFHIEVSSGVDWFELHGAVEYEGVTARLPELLDALRRGQGMVELSDGAYGVLPEEWLRKIGAMASMGAAEEGHIRFRRSQAGLLDALLAAQPEAKYDDTFARVRDELRQFEGVKALDQPTGFQGQLRDYQRDGLGWMEFLRRFGFGGCLADDMGVGKTAQVLALLERRREARAAGEPIGPSLVVVPRSLVFNWMQEAARFTPQLRVLDHTGLARGAADFSAYDLVLTTYGTLRRDVPLLGDTEFDYLVLDEAQAIKNADTESAKAARLLRGKYRLALSGTPVENHLGELWSIFEFLNPGMLGSANVFKLAGAGSRTADEETRQMLAQAVRPFILRRTKEQVARELPPKTEQTLYCEMEPEQRKLYEELRQHYRATLLGKIAAEGIGKSKIQVLEALLRLRQAACHPGLVDPKRRGEGSAKLDTLISQLREVLDEGHKALVFSQFTSMLSIVRSRLDEAGVTYEYLDGKTRDRQQHVERFQNDPDCKLFLVSLKAGGVGLNLTAAEYVFLLDPWWNPAVESQAIDRAHRIGQTHNVFAYRLIAQGTVEEKVLELQASKRDLAAAIIQADNSLIRNLKREDLELLLS
ncbi:MAG TPA: DEAD/DEAH box helicase [Bryobacteraceae bacterium]|nr:DEAD/DEAH box helicase [Bryobacteraceae bacterium]